MDRRGEKPQEQPEPDFSAADPTEAFQGKAARKFLEKNKGSFETNGTIPFNGENNAQIVSMQLVEEARSKGMVQEPVEPFDSLGVWDQKFAKPAGIKFK